MIETARDGRSAALIVHGEAGVGKTSLLRAAAEHAPGLRVLRARGIESESHLPFAALSELLAPLLDLRGEIPPVQAQALGGALALEAATVSDRFAVAAGVLGCGWRCGLGGACVCRGCGVRGGGGLGVVRLCCADEVKLLFVFFFVLF